MGACNGRRAANCTRQLTSLFAQRSNNGAEMRTSGLASRAQINDHFRLAVHKAINCICMRTCCHEKRRLSGRRCDFERPHPYSFAYTLYLSRQSEQRCQFTHAAPLSSAYYINYMSFLKSTKVPLRDLSITRQWRITDNGSKISNNSK